MKTIISLSAKILTDLPKQIKAAKAELVAVQAKLNGLYTQQSAVAASTFKDLFKAEGLTLKAQNTSDGTTQFKVLGHRITGGAFNSIMLTVVDATGGAVLTSNETQSVTTIGYKTTTSARSKVDTRVVVKATPVSVKSAIKRILARATKLSTQKPSTRRVMVK
jgi:hypothetical protein